MLALAAAPHAGAPYDSAMTALSLVGYSMPIFWLGQLLVILFAIQLGWLPAQGMITLRNTPTGLAAVRDVLWHLVLPALQRHDLLHRRSLLAWRGQALLETISQDYVLTARGEGSVAGAPCFGGTCCPTL